MKRVSAVLFFLLVTALFFWPVCLKGQIPFPGDLLVGNATPWHTDGYLGYAPGGVPHKAQGIDVIRQLFPWKQFSVRMIKKGEWPFWNPYNFAGTPHLANFQSGVFYPLNVVFFVLPFLTAWTLFIFLQPFLAGFFTYLFSSELKVSRSGSLFSGFAFAFCLYLTVWLEWGNVGHAILWLPLSLLWAEKLVKDAKFRWGLLLTSALTFSLLAGYVQATIYLFLTVAAFFIFRLCTVREKRGKESGKKLILFFGSLVFSLLLSLPQLLPTWHLFSQSAREAYPADKVSELLLPWFYPITNLASDFFGNPASRNYWLPGTYIERVSYLGVLPFFFAFLAVLKRSRNKAVLFFTVLAGLALVMSLNTPLARYFYSLKIPIISTVVYTRLLALFSFSLAVLAGFGIDVWFKNKKISFLIKPIFLATGAYLFLWLFTFWGQRIFPDAWWVSHLSVSQRNLILPTGFLAGGVGLIFLGFKFPKRCVFWGLTTITLFDLFYYFHKITPFSPPEFVYPETKVVRYLQENAGINRFWGYGSGYIDSNFSTQNQTFSPDGYDPLFIRRYGELISASEDGEIKNPLSRSDAVLAGGFGPDDLKENLDRQRLLNLLGVKYVTHKIDGLSEAWQPDYQTFPEDVYRLVWQEGAWQVYENKQVLPRIFLAGDYQVETEKQKIIALILDPDFPLREKIILEEPLPEKTVLDQKGEGKIGEIDYQPNRVDVEVQADGNVLLFLSDNYYDRWQARIDGLKTKLYRADYSFRAVLVPQGQHRVVFYYQPGLY